MLFQQAATHKGGDFLSKTLDNFDQGLKTTI